MGWMWDQCGMDVGWMWDGCGINVGSMWDQCGINVGSMWDQCGNEMDLGQTFYYLTEASFMGGRYPPLKTWPGYLPATSGNGSVKTRC